MAIEQTRSAEARAPVGPQGANRNRDGDNAGGESFNSVLGSVDSGENTEASAPARETEPSVEDKGRREGKSTKAHTKADGAADDAAPTATQAASSFVSADAPVATAPDASDASTLAAALAGSLGGPASALAAAAVGALANAASQAAQTPSTVRASTTELPGIDAIAASASMAAGEGTRGVAGAGPRAAGSGAGGPRGAPGVESDAGASATSAAADGASRPRIARGLTGALQGAAQGQNAQTSIQGTQTALQQAGQAVAQEVRDTTGKPMVDEAMQRLIAQTQSADTATAGADLSNELRSLRRGGASEGSGAAGNVTASGNAAVDTAWNRHALTSDAASPVGGLPADANRTGMEDRMAAQVSYWLSQNTQSAELSLDTLGGPPVEVSIQVKGNEAQVAFRSDHANTRELLGNSLTQLRDLLTSEGLQLSGVTVDSGALAQAQTQSQSQSGAGSDGGREGRSGMRQIGTVEVPVAAARGIPAGSSGRSLDLFV